MSLVEVKRDNESTLRFTGEMLADVSSHSEKNKTRWTVLRLYKTQGGKYVCQSIGRTRFEGEVDRFSATVVDDEAGVIAFFRHGSLAKALYDYADIDDIEDIA